MSSNTPLDDVADGPERYDVILDRGGNRPVSHLRYALAPQGTLVLAGSRSGDRETGGMGRAVRAVATSPAAHCRWH